MDTPQEQPWSHPGEQFDLLPGVADDADFGSFLDLNLDQNLDQEFQMFNNAVSAAEQEQSANIQDVLDPQLMQPTPNQQQLRQQRHQLPQSHDQNNPNFALAAADQNGSSMYNMGHGGQFDQMQHATDKRAMFMHDNPNFHPHGVVPPTPNSIQMHGDPVRYMQQLDPQTRAALEQQYQMRKEGMITFTPLVSPAVTPHDARFQMPQDYTTVPGAYFSPLTSPALEGQNHTGNHTPQFHPSATQSNSSNNTSPIDIDVDMLGEAALPQPTPNRKSGRKRPGTSGSGSVRVRQSPLVKARESKRKNTISSAVSPNEMAGMREQGHKSQHQTRREALSVPESQSTSDGGSISPEPLSEAVMGPPPKPGSAMQSPAIQAQNDQSRGVIPATPASLMRIVNNKVPAGQKVLMSPPSAAQEGLRRNASSLEDLTLPEAAVTSRHSTNGGTPRASTHPTPKLGPQITSTASTPLASPLTPSFPAAGSKRGSTAEPKSGRGKKRNSTSISEGRPPAPSNSTLISPALRPKISPSIKPLQPSSVPTSNAGSVPPTPLSISEQTAHLLLASKSNYQHLVDGTNVNVPGLEYPESLSTGLTSKRTSHKIAEQGRRNRINIALAEMGRLLPPELKGVKSPVIDAMDGKSPDSAASAAGGKKTNGAAGSAAAAGSNAANAGNSKAATVESAIMYIRMLQQQAEDRDYAMKEKEREIEVLRRRLAGTTSNIEEEEEDEQGLAAKRRGEEMEVVVESNRTVQGKDDGKDSNMDVDGRMEDG